MIGLYLLPISINIHLISFWEKGSIRKGPAYFYCRYGVFWGLDIWGVPKKTGYIWDFVSKSRCSLF